MKILIIGNSFAAAIRAAIPRNDKSISFVCGSGEVLQGIELADNQDAIKLGASFDTPTQRKLWKISSGNSGAFSLKGFDAHIVVGLFRPPNPWAARNFQATDARLPDIEELGPPVSFRLYCEISLYKEYKQRVDRWMKLLRAHDKERKVYFVPSPHIMLGAEQLLDGHDISDWWPGSEPDWWKQSSDKERKILQLNEHTLYKKYLEQSGGEVILPPAETIVNGNRCPEHFTKNALGSANFEDGVPPQWTTPNSIRNYLLHKNAEYGKVIWDNAHTTIINGHQRAFSRLWSGVHSTFQDWFS